MATKERKVLRIVRETLKKERAEYERMNPEDCKKAKEAQKAFARNNRWPDRPIVESEQ